MPKFVILLRAVNVGGNNLLPMKELKKVLSDAGFQNVVTYIQSGNIVLESKRDPSRRIGDLIAHEFGIRPKIKALSEPDFNLAVENNPYKQSDGKHAHFYFCHHQPKLVEAMLNQYTATTELFELHGQVFYLYAPEGIGRSKLVANIDKCLGVSTTGRNLNTINKLRSMLA